MRCSRIIASPSLSSWLEWFPARRKPIAYSCGLNLLIRCIYWDIQTSYYVTLGRMFNLTEAFFEWVILWLRLRLTILCTEHIESLLRDSKCRERAGVWSVYIRSLFHSIRTPCFIPKTCICDADKVGPKEENTKGYSSSIRTFEILLQLDKYKVFVVDKVLGTLISISQRAPNIEI